MNWIWRHFYRQYRVLSWMRYVTTRRLTPAGWTVLLCLFMTLLMGINRESMVSYQAIALLLFLILSATVPSFFFRAKLSVARGLPRFGTVGQPLTYRVIVKNLTTKTLADLFLLEDLADPRPSFEDWLAFKLAEQRSVRSFWYGGRLPAVPTSAARVRLVALPALPPGREVEAPVEIIPLRRGVLMFAGTSVAHPDPFGLFRAIVKLPQPGKILILPRRYPLPPLALPGSLKYQEGGVALAANVGQSDEFVSLRDYRRGDPLRHIHWRSWARTGKPIVKEFEDEFFVRHALVLDTFGDRAHGDLFEEAVSVAASFACTLQTQESLLDLLFVGAEAYSFTSGRGLAHADQMLEILAAVRPAKGKTVDDLEHLVVNHSALVSNCICVFLDWDEPRQRFVKKLRTASVPVMVVVLVDKAPLKPLDPGPLRDEPASFHTLVLGDVEAGLQKL
jgi:uncharacterized protein (DUF58 family)